MGQGTVVRRVPRLPLGLRALPAAWRQDRPPQRPALILLVASSLAWTVLALQVGVEFFTPGFQTLTLLAGGLLLQPRALLLLMGVCAADLLVLIVFLGLEEVRSGALLVMAITGFACYEFARSREQTGLGAFGSENVLLELRDRLEQHGALPALPVGWLVDSVVRPAGDAPFAGDFVVSARTGSRLEIALVDVSGKGVEAGTRSLLLSGALGGLLGSADPEVFLAAANTYLLRQDWEEGFATAVHVAVDLRTGAYAVASAGHPPVAQFDSGTGRWSLLDATGTALGLIDEMDYTAVTGTLDPGDALLMYTDGLVEVPGRDLSSGIDKLLGEAERAVSQGYAGGADALVTRVAADSSDDRGLVLLRRAD